MIVNKYFFLVFIFLTISACDSSKVTEPSQSKVVQGLDMDGLPKKCTENPNLICDKSFGPGDQFALDCRAQGKKAIACDCHDYICIDAVVRSGVDINGDGRSCSPVSSDAICTAEYTQEDQFAEDCRDSGFEAVQCGCHDFICVK